MSPWLLNLIACIVTLSPLIFIHEFGHYLVARWNGVKVESFSIGFGPQLFGWTDNNGTRWKISLLLFGGYVKMFGDEDAASTPDRKALKKLSEKEKSKMFQFKKPWQRICIAAAGPISNYLFSFLIFLGLFIYPGEQIFFPYVGQIAPNSNALKAGIHEGDKILSVQGKPIKTFTNLLKDLSQISMKENLNIFVSRAQDTFEITIPSPDPHSDKSWFGNLGIGPNPKESEHKTYAFPQAISKAWSKIVSLTEQPFTIIKERQFGNLGGPLGIAQQAGKILEQGWSSVLWFIAMLSASLGFLNLLPIPLLDGGSIFFYSIEWITGRSLSEKVQNVIVIVGLVFLLSLFVILSWNDLQRSETFKEFSQKISTFFSKQ